MQRTPAKSAIRKKTLVCAAFFFSFVPQNGAPGVLRRILCWPLAVVMPAFVALPLAAQAEIAPVCDASRPFASADDLNGFASPCATAPGKIALDAVYLQNASSVGGTALAAFPMMRLRTGLSHRLQVVLDTPSQIAESKPGGGGLWPVSHLGYGIDYMFLQTQRMVVALQTEVLPPATVFAPSQTQSRYQFAVTSDFQITPRLGLGVSAAGTSSGSVGFERVLPALTFRTAYDLSANTQIVTGLGTRIVGRHEVSQSVGNIAVNQRLYKNTLFGVGVGTSFNAVANAKVHYLASGFSFRR